MIVFAVLAAACDGEHADKPKENAPAPLAVDAVTFRFDDAELVPALQKEGNWCRMKFDDPVLISADPADYNRRLFRLSEDVCLVNIRLGTTVSTFMLHAAGEKQIAVSTSRNYSECLSNYSNFSLSGNGTSLTYDNQHFIKYTLEATRDDEGLIVYINLTPEISYGITVYRSVGQH
ncbi:MAG: hypothetical protein H6575_08565 [Lewinellaceae bacterium]|nr:hypothetical protein [Lewinellaceae bacterium]